MIEDTTAVRWRLRDEPLSMAKEMAVKKDLQITRLIEYAISKLHAELNALPAPKAPWEATKRKPSGEYGQNYTKYLGEEGKKTSLAWMLADDEEFWNRLVASANMYGGYKVTRKELFELAGEVYNSRPREFGDKILKLPVINRLAAILRAHGKLIWLQRNAYQVVVDWTPAMDPTRPKPPIDMAEFERQAKAYNESAPVLTPEELDAIFNGSDEPPAYSDDPDYTEEDGE